MEESVGSMAEPLPDSGTAVTAVVLCPHPQALVVAQGTAFLPPHLQEDGCWHIESPPGKLLQIKRQQDTCLK